MAKKRGRVSPGGLVAAHRLLRPAAALAASCFLAVCAGCGGSAGMQMQASADGPVWPAAPDQARVRFLYTISKPEDIGWAPSLLERTLKIFAGPENYRRMVRPHGLCLGPDEVLYVADPGLNAVHRFGLRDRRYRQIRKFEKLDLKSPVGVAADGAGNLFVSDSELKRVFRYDASGKAVSEFGKGAEFLRPTGLAVDRRLKRLYVVDTADHAVKVFDLQGNILFELGQRGTGEGEFNFPTAVGVDANGNLYVNDSLNFRVQAFDPDGNFLYLFGKHGDGTGEFSQPKGLALDSEGHIYIADAIFDAVQIFNHKGELMLLFCESGHRPGRLWMPASVFIDQRDRIFVSDSYNQRVQVFEFLGGDGT